MWRRSMPVPTRERDSSGLTSTALLLATSATDEPAVPVLGVARPARRAKEGSSVET
jgi:hypothetical protein